MILQGDSAVLTDQQCSQRQPYQNSDMVKLPEPSCAILLDQCKILRMFLSTGWAACSQTSWPCVLGKLLHDIRLCCWGGTDGLMEDAWSTAVTAKPATNPGTLFLRIQSFHTFANFLFGSAQVQLCACQVCMGSGQGVSLQNLQRRLVCDTSTG